MAEFEVVRSMPYYDENETYMDRVLSFSATATCEEYPYYGMYDYTTNCYLIFSSLSLEHHVLQFECKDNETIAEFESRLSIEFSEMFGENYVKITKVSTTYSLMNELRWE